MTEKKTYLRTHPWIKFNIDLQSAPTSLWMNLGECKSKCEHISGAPLRPAVAEQLSKHFLAKGVLATTAIEGNMLSEEQVLKHLDGKLELPPSREYLKQEIDNIIEGCNSITRDIQCGKKPDLTPGRIKELNKLVLRNLKLSEGVVPGEVRDYSVGVAHYHGAPAEDCGYLLGLLCEWLNGDVFKPAAGMEIVYAIIRAVVAHLYLAWIHPFGDGNGRTARLVEFQVLISSGVPAPAAQLLSNHYNQTRSEYYSQLDRASRSGGDVLAFLDYAVKGFLDGLRDQLAQVWEQMYDVVWRSYVHQKFEGHAGAADERRKNLLLDLSWHKEPVKVAELALLSPRVARAYAAKNARTLARDVSKLVEMDLVVIEPSGVRPRKEVIRAFLPVKAEAQACKSSS